MNGLLDALPAADAPLALVLVMGAVALAYAVFTLVGFGSALVASGPLAQLMPVAAVVSLLALLDFVGSSLRGWRARKDVSWTAFARLLPGMLLGQGIGVVFLAQLPAALMALGLGLFVVSQGLRGLITARVGAGNPPPYPGLAYGLMGGVLGGLFGSGGFVYAAYLERRLENRAEFRATQALLIALSTGWRILLCLFAGLVTGPLLLTALAFVPAMVLGVMVGQRMDVRISRDQLYRLLNALLLLSGLSLAARSLG